MSGSDTIPAGHDLAQLTAGLDLQVEYLPTQSLVAFGRKTRSHTRAQIDQLMRAITEFGFLVPVLVDEASKVLAGNARLEAARRLKLAQVPVVRLAHLTPEKKRAFAIADNRLAELAGWDRDALRLEFEELSAIELDFELELTGFSEPQIDAILVGGAGGDERGDRLPSPLEDVASQLGDLWLLGPHRLICADSTQPDTFTKLLQGEPVRTVFTDPPYNVRVDGHVTSNKDHGEFVMASGEMSDAEFTQFLKDVWDRIAESLVPGGLAYLCMDWRHMRHTLEAADPSGLQLLNLLVWDKKAGGMGSFYRSRHELIFLMKRHGEAHQNRVQLGSNGRDRSNVWSYEGVNGFGAGKAKARDLHPTVKPLALVRDAILDSSAKGDLVLDLFSGSGTTLIAAHDAGRRGRAVELDPRYVDTGVIRWQDFTGQEARLAETGETFAEVRARRGREAQQSAIGADRRPVAEEV